MIHHLSIDLETYSSVPIAKAGAYKYIASNDFEILLFAYSVDDAPVEIIDLAQGEQVPDWLKAALYDPSYIKHAYNAPFEYGCLSKYYGTLIPAQWRCTMFHGLYCGYTAGLDATGKALGLPEDKQKLNTGKALIRYFCVPCKPTKSNGQRTRNYPHHDPEKWKLFKEYCVQDVVTEKEIDRRLSGFPVPDFVQKQWETDLMINARGVAVDMPFVDGALVMGESVKAELTQEAMDISNLDNPNSVKQLTRWLNANTDDSTEFTDLRKDTVSKALSEGLEERPDVTRMLEIRQELGKTSTKKYDAIKICVCPDDRVRGLLQFYGANRTGRWAGRLVQVQNLPRTYTNPIELARELVVDRKTNAMRCLYGSVSDTLSQLIRTAFIASPGNKLIDADFAAIEARVISWLAGEEWKIKAFEQGKDIYCETASQMFGVPVEKHGANKELRQRGKVAELACGYGGGVGAMRNMDVSGLLESMPDDEVMDMVKRWRNSNANICSLWREFDDAAMNATQYGGRYLVNGRVLVAREVDTANGYVYLTIGLPSGRKLFYCNPHTTLNRFGNPSIAYNGINQTTKKWEEVETYGGKLVENVTQAIARDCLAFAIENLEAAGYPIVFHVHDEVVIDMKPYASDEKMLEDVVNIMKKTAPWAAGMPLNADGWVGDFFTKD